MPIKKAFGSSGYQTLEAIWKLLRNAFIQALMPGIDHQINLKSVDEAETADKRNLLQKLFGKNKKDDRDKNNGNQKQARTTTTKNTMKKETTWKQ